MKFTNAMQLKAWINNRAKKLNIPAPDLMKIYMLERLLERITLSKYRDKLILKGGFLIASMIGVDLRTTVDMDATIKNIKINRYNIIEVMNEIITIEVDDGIKFAIQSISDIHEESEYDDFRMILVANYLTIKTHIQVDFTTGHVIIPHEIEYSYKLMFEERTIKVMAYNLNTIFAEKIEAILSRNITGTRMRDYYDVYILISLNKKTIKKQEVVDAIKIKAKERNTLNYVNDYKNLLEKIGSDAKINKLWSAYQKEYNYAKDINFTDIISVIAWIFDESN